MAKQKDRHSDVTLTVSIRLDVEDWYQLQELISRSPLPHSTVGGYLRWLIETQALRPR